MDRNQRIGELKEFISRHRHDESYFDELYSKLLNEIRLEEVFNDDLNTNRYLYHLLETRKKQAEAYREIRRKGGKAKKYEAFQTFTGDFIADVLGAWIPPQNEVTE